MSELNEAEQQQQTPAGDPNPDTGTEPAAEQDEPTTTSYDDAKAKHDAGDALTDADVSALERGPDVAASEPEPQATPPAQPSEPASSWPGH